MSDIKQIIRRTPLIKVWRTIVNKKERMKLERFNKKYRKYIEPLLDPDVLESKINQLTATLEKASCTYYVISLQNERIGIFGYINNILPHIAYAVARGYIPVINMQNYPSIYQVGKENAWEKFFEQPCGIGMDDLADKKVICSPNTYWWRWQPDSCPLMSDQAIRLWGKLYQQYIRYTKKSLQYLENEINIVLKYPHKTLGVLYRGTDYAKGHAIGHPIQPSMRVFADQVEEVMERNGLVYIYLASDEKGIVDYMNQRFPGRVLINKRVYYDEVQNVDYSNYNVDHIGVSGARFDRENNEYLIGIEYISSMNLVANCAAFVAGACGGQRQSCI